MSSIATNPYCKTGRESNPSRYSRAVDWPADDSAANQVWTPAVDIYETKEEIVVKTELPGIKKEDLQVNLENNLLTISGSRQSGDENTRSVLRLERQFGSFNRRFTLPGNIDHGRISSDFNQGILLVHLPKREEAKPRQIEVTVN